MGIESIKLKSDYGENLLSLLKMQTEMIIKSHSKKTSPNIVPTADEVMRTSIQIQDDMNKLHEIMREFYMRIIPEYEYRKAITNYD